MPGLDAVFVPLPECCLQQIGVVLHEDAAHRRVTQQERAKGLGEHVLGAHAVPDLARHFVFFIARHGHFAELAVGDVFDLVVVVKHHLAVAGDSEVLPQHVTGENIRRHQIFDRVAILNHTAFYLLACTLRHRALVRGVSATGIECFLQVDVERDHTSLDVDVFDDDFDVAITIAVADLQLAGGELFYFSNQLVVKAVTRKAHLAVLQRVRHAAHTVVLLHQQVLALDLLAGGVLLRWVVVFDDLEHIGKRRQIKHQHHHALDAGRDAELVGAVALVVQQVTVEQCLALFGQAQGVVDFVARFARHHAAQKLHIGRGNLHVHHEVGARKAEQHQ